MPLLNTFCRCGSLRTGSLVAAVAGIILAILGIILIWTVKLDLRTIVLDWLPKLAVQIIVTINFAMTVLISILLIFGIIKRNMYLMIPWVILGLMLAIGLLVSVIYTAVNFFIEGQNDLGITWIVLGLLAVVVYIYMWMVVYSYFTIIKDETNRGLYKKPPFMRQW